MMTCFYQASSLWQTVLLIISQLAVISLAASAIVLFKRKCKLTKQFGTGAVFTLNVVLYIVMQLDSRLTGDTPKRSGSIHTRQQGTHRPDENKSTARCSEQT